MKTTTNLIAVICFCTLMTGCGASRTRVAGKPKVERWSQGPKAPFLDAHKATVAVLPFETPEFDKLNYNVKRMRKYEQAIHYPGRLVHALENSPWVREAYVTPISVPSVDLVLRGQILESTGYKASVRIEILAPTGEVKQTVSRAIDFSQAKNLEDPLDRLMAHVANRVGHFYVAFHQDLRSSRVEAYAERDIDFEPPELIQNMVEDAARVERTKLLAPVTDLTLATAAKSQRAYTDWEHRSMRIYEAVQAKRRAAERQRKEADRKAGMAFFKGALSLGGLMSGGIGSGLGDAVKVTGSLVGTAAEMSNAEQFDRLAEIQEEAAKDLLEAGVRFQGEVGDAIRDLTIEFEDGVLSLTGTVDAQLAQFRQMIKKKVRAALEGYVAKRKAELRVTNRAVSVNVPSRQR